MMVGYHMTAEDTLVIRSEIRSNGVAVVRINRPEAKNALNTEVRHRLAEIFHALAGDARGCHKKEPGSAWRSRVLY